MNTNDFTAVEQQTICLAAICQVSSQILQLARHGTWDEEDSRILIRALAVDSATPLEEIYPIAKVTPGLKSFFKTFSKNNGTGPKFTDSDIDVARMVVKFLNLGTSIYKQLFDMHSFSIFPNKWKFRHELLSKLDNALTQAKNSGYSPTSDMNTANIAAVYMEEISARTKGDIKIFGKALYLKQPIIQNRIRTLIFAAVRAVVLWRQLGGKRRIFIFRRNQMLSCAQRLLQHNV